MALTEIIQSLHTTGHMNTALSRSAVKRNIEEHAKVRTPHGSVVQIMQVGETQVEYIHPAALLYYLCSISACFRDTMASAKESSADGVRQVVLDSDAATPVDVFRPVSA